MGTVRSSACTGMGAPAEYTAPDRAGPARARHAPTGLPVPGAVGGVGRTGCGRVQPTARRTPHPARATRERTPGDRGPVRRRRTALAEWATEIRTGNASRAMATFRNLVIALAHLVGRNNQGVAIDHYRSDPIHVLPHHAQWLKESASW